MCYDAILTLLLQPFPSITPNSKIGNIFSCSTVSWFHGFTISQSCIILYRTQCVINIQLCLCWKVQVSSIKIFQIFFDRHCLLTIFSAGKFHNGPAIIFNQSMAGFCFVPRNIYTNMVQNSADSGL